MDAYINAAPDWQGVSLSAIDPELILLKSIGYSKTVERRLNVKIRPLQDRVIVKRIAEEEKSKGGIIIPDTAKEKPQEGKVVAVGKGKVKDDGTVTPLDVKVNDRILFGKYAGTEINFNGEEHLIMREDDILGILEK
jgi:chaperonin GroES